MGYGTTAGADAYHTARGNTAWAGLSETQKSQALVRATDYIRTTYVIRFDPAYDEDAPEVESATYEAALLEGITPNFFSVTFTEGDRKVLTEVKGIKWTFVGTSGDARKMAPTSSLIENLLWPYMARHYGSLVV